MSRLAAIRFSPAVLALALTLALVAACVRSAPAATAYTWAAGVNGAADDPTKWAPNAVPDSTSTLTYDKFASYTVTFGPGVPMSVSQKILGGGVTFDVAGTHLMGSLVCAGGNTVLDACDIDGRLGSGTWVSVANAQLLLNHGTNLRGWGTIGNDTDPSALDIGLGARLRVSAGLELRRTGWVTVSGSEAGRFSGLEMQTSLPLTVGGNLFAHSGAFIDAQGPVLITGGLQGSTQAVRIGPGAPAGDSYLDTRSNLIVGHKTGIPNLTMFGRAEFDVNDRSWVNVAGMTQVGDSIGDEGCAIRVMQGGRFIANGGLKVFSTLGTPLDLRGGVMHVRGGRFQWPAGRMLTVSSGVGTPELWIGNGDSNVGPNVGSAFSVGLMVGRGGHGTLRVTRPGTVLPVTGAAAVGDSAGGVGTLEADSSATLAISGTLAIGTQGYGRLRVRNGADVTAATTYLGADLTGNGGIDVSGAGSTFTAKDNLHIGGGDLGSGSTGSMVVDSNATVSVVPTGINASRVVVYPTAGSLAVANGGALSAGGIEARGSVSLAGGNLSALSTSVFTTGGVSGWGAISGHLYNSGSVSPFAYTHNFGRLVVNGNFMQFATGRYRVQLGSTDGRRCDTLTVSGSASLDGTLDITPAVGFVRTPGDTFTVLTCGSRTGTFATVTWNGFTVTDQVQVQYEANAVKVVIPFGSVSVDAGGAPAGLSFASAGGRGRLAFELDLPEAADVEVAVYDVTGRHVATLADGAFAAGRHTMSAPARDLISSGMYFARAVVRTPKGTVTRVAKATLLH